MEIYISNRILSSINKKMEEHLCKTCLFLTENVCLYSIAFSTAKYEKLFIFYCENSQQYNETYSFRNKQILHKCFPIVSLILLNIHIGYRLDGNQT